MPNTWLVEPHGASLKTYWFEELMAASCNCNSTPILGESQSITINQRTLGYHTSNNIPTSTQNLINHTRVIPLILSLSLSHSLTTCNPHTHVKSLHLPPFSPPPTKLGALQNLSYHPYPSELVGKSNSQKLRVLLKYSSQIVSITHK